MASIARARHVVAALLVFVGAGRPLQAQGPELDEVKRVIRQETESYYRRDAEAWQGTWVNDSTAIRTFITGSSYSVQRGWDKFGPGTVAALRRDPAPQSVQIDRTNYVLRVDGGLAWAEYDERTNYPDGRTPPLLARQQRTLLKQNGRWRILSAGSFVESSFGTAPGAIEGRLDAIGNDLIVAKNTAAAISVLALNAQLFPRSAAAHRDLGAAYAAAGQTQRAIDSYEASLAIDSTNAASRAALAKLREKR